MGGYADKLGKAAAGVLRPGERVLAAIRTQPRGTTTGTAVGGLIGGAIAARQAAKAQAGAAAGSGAANWPQGRCAVGLSDQRLLLFDYTAMGKPKDLVAQYELGEVAAIDLDSKKLTQAVRFSFTDGSSVVVECARMEKVDDLLAAYKALSV